VSGLGWRSLADVRGEPALPVCVCDLVRTSENFHPHYSVIAVADDRVWIRDVQHGTDHVVPIGKCQRIEPKSGAQRATQG